MNIKRSELFFHVSEMVSIDGVKMYACRFCAKVQSSRSNMANHERVHTQEKPFFCWCGASFTQKSNLRRHQVSLGHESKNTDF